MESYPSALSDIDDFVPTHSQHTDRTKSGKGKKLPTDSYSFNRNQDKNQERTTNTKNHNHLKRTHAQPLLIEEGENLSHPLLYTSNSSLKVQI
jgi:hypothetical protein